MGEPGMVQGCKWEPSGTELTAAASAGATVLHVDWTGHFDDGSVVDIDGDRIEILLVDSDAKTLTLSAGLAAAADDGDPVYLVSGGQVVVDYVATVTLGVGQPADVVIPYEQRDLWPEGEYDTPVPVVLSDDLEKIIGVPGRAPVRSGGAASSPFLSDESAPFVARSEASLGQPFAARLDLSSGSDRDDPGSGMRAALTAALLQLVGTLDLGRANSSLIEGIRFGAVYSGVTDAAGYISVPHGLSYGAGVEPTVVFIQQTAYAGKYGMVTAKDDTYFWVTVRDRATNDIAVEGENLSFHWLAIA